MKSYPRALRRRLRGRPWSLAAGFAAAFSTVLAPLAHSASGTWNLNNNGSWSGTANWAGNVIADGAGSTGDFTQVDLTANRTVTIDGAVASRTLGALILGDSTSGTAGFNNYTIAASGGGTLTFNNLGSAATLTQAVNSGANTISAPIVLADDLNIFNNSASSLTLSGTITGAKVITNLGSGTGTTAINGVIGTGVAGVVQNSASSMLTLGGTNTFTTGVQIKQGTVLANANAALGTGTLTLGDTSGSADATLLIGSVTLANTINVQAGSTGTLTIGGNGNAAARPTGNIILNNNVRFSVEGGGQSGRSTGSLMTASGTISGTGNVSLDVDGAAFTTNNAGQPQGDSLVLSGPVTTSGTIFNTGAGSGRSSITGNISNAAGLVQNSATSMLSLSGTNTYSGPTLVNAGVLRMTSTAAYSANSAITVANGATLQLSQAQTVAVHTGQSATISGFGTSYSFGAMDSTNNANYGGNVILAADAAVSSDLATTTLTLGGSITGSGNTLTTSGVGTVAITGSLATGSGGLTKVGSGTLTLSGSNSFTGVTTISNGVVLLNSASALAGGGNITFNGGTLRHSSSNLLDLGNRVANSTGPIAIDTAGQNVTYSDIGSSNTGGLAKIGTGRLTLSGTNSFSGGIVVNGGVLAVSAASAIPSVGTGSIFVANGGALNSGGAYTGVQGWLDSGNINSSSTGAIALTGNSSENIDFTGYNGLSLGASANSTYTGAITSSGGVYRLGGGGATLTLSGNNALTGANDLVVSNSPVTITGSNSLSGATTVSSSVLTVSGSVGSLANSAVTVGSGATLAFVSGTGAASVTRAASVTLNRGTMTVSGTTTANSTHGVTGALNVGAGGNSTITVTAASTRNTLLTADNLAHSAGGTVLVRGTNLGVNSILSATGSSSNIQLANAVLVGGSGTNTTDGGIFVGAVGDTSATGTGYGATGGLLTYDSANGVRLLSNSEYKTTITDGQTQLDNVRLSGTAGSTVTTTVNNNTTINSLSLRASTTVGSSVQVAGTGTLTLNSGVIYATAISPAASGLGISNAIDFNGREGIVMSGVANSLTLSGVLANTGGNGLTFAGTGRTILAGSSANTYTGTTTVNGGTLELNKTAGVDAITGDLVLNVGGVVTTSASNQINDASNVFVNGGWIDLTLAETVNNFSMTNSGTATIDNLNVNGNLSIAGGAQMTTGVARTLAVTGAMNLSDGGTLEIRRSQNIGGAYDTVVSVGGLNITNATSGAYTAITIGHGAGLPQSGGKLVLNGDVTFTGNSTNTNTVLIDAIKGTGRQGIIELNGTRAFDIGNGAAKVDLRITGGLFDGASAGGLTKNGAGTLDLTGSSGFTGATTVNAGTLLLNGTSVSAVTVTGGVFGGTGTNFNSVAIGASGTLAPGNSAGMLNTGNLSFTGSTSTLAAEIGGVSAGLYDQANVTGSVSLDGNGRIEVTMLSYVPQPTDIFFLVLNDGVDAISGTLYGIAQDGTFSSGGYTWQVSYVGNSATNSFTGGNDLAIQLVPEPSTWVLLTGGLMAMAFRRRRNR